MASPPPTGYRENPNPPQQVAACSSCGRPIDPTTAVYSKWGALICRYCEAGAQVHETMGRAVGPYWLIAGIAGIAGFVGMWCMWYVSWIPGTVALVSGIYSVRLLARPDVVRHVGGRRGSMLAWSWIGIVGGVLQLLALGALVLFAMYREGQAERGYGGY
jgi:hypothetical protein